MVANATLPLSEKPKLKGRPPEQRQRKPKRVTMPGFRPTRTEFPRNPDTGIPLDTSTQLLPEITPEENEIIIKAVRKYSQLQSWKAMVALAVDWAIIIGCFAAAIHFPHPLLVVGAMIVIGSRQHALMILMHEAVHYRLFDNRFLAERISNWFMVYPLGFETEAFRKHHLAHHNFLNTDDDPDWTRKVGKKAWRFPKTKWGLVQVLLLDLIGINTIELLRPFVGSFLKKKTKNGPARETNKRFNWGRLAYYILPFTFISLAGLWSWVFLLWVVPQLTILHLFSRLRSISEHWGVEGKDLLTMTRTYPGTVLERFFIVPHGINYHIEHHIYPSVPYYNLPKLREVLMTIPVYAEGSHQTDTILGLSGSSVLQELTN